MAYEMSEGSNENCEFYENFTRITRTAKIRKTSEGPNENYENCKYSQRYPEWLTRCQRDSTRTANFTKITRFTRTAKIRKLTRITITANIRKGTKNGLRDVRGIQRELRILRKLRELRELRKLARSQRDPTRITRVTKLHKFAKVPRMAYEMSEGPNKNCEFYENYENYENCENFQDPCGTQRELRKLHKFAKVPRNTSGKTALEPRLQLEKITQSIMRIHVFLE